MTDIDMLINLLKAKDRGLFNALDAFGWHELGEGSYTRCYAHDEMDLVVRESRGGRYGMHMGADFLELVELQSMGLECFTPVIAHIGHREVTYCISKRVKGHERSLTKKRVYTQIGERLELHYRILEDTLSSYPVQRAIIEAFKDFGIEVADMHWNNFYIHEDGRIEIFDYGCYCGGWNARLINWGLFWDKIALALIDDICY